jgi:hypothetical protein
VGVFIQQQIFSDVTSKQATMGWSDFTKSFKKHGAVGKAFSKHGAVGKAFSKHGIVGAPVTFVANTAAHVVTKGVDTGFKLADVATDNIGKMGDLVSSPVVWIAGAVVALVVLPKVL